MIIASLLVFLSGACLGTAAFFWETKEIVESPLFFNKSLKKKKEKKSQSFKFAMQTDGAKVSYAQVEGAFRLFFFPSRPNSSVKEEQLFLEIKDSGDVKRVDLSQKIYLKVDPQGHLSFSSSEVPFWLECKKKKRGEVDVQVFVDRDAKCEERFSLKVEQTPLLSVENIPEDSPFQQLIESCWLGVDLLKQSVEGKDLYRFHLLKPNENLEISRDEWLVFDQGKWQRGQDLSLSYLAHIEKIEDETIYFEGWMEDTYLRLTLPLAHPPIFQPNLEELFGSLRIRSDKQMSCTLEKKCLILKLGDWAFKKENQWKVLSKKEDQKALLESHFLGEVFVFEKIENRQGQKFVVGSLYDPDHCQKVQVSLLGGFARKSRETNKLKTKGINP